MKLVDFLIVGLLISAIFVAGITYMSSITHEYNVDYINKTSVNDSKIMDVMNETQAISDSLKSSNIANTNSALDLSLKAIPAIELTIKYISILKDMITATIYDYQIPPVYGTIFVTILFAVLLFILLSVIIRWFV